MSVDTPLIPLAPFLFISCSGYNMFGVVFKHTPIEDKVDDDPFNWSDRSPNLISIPRICNHSLLSELINRLGLSIVDVGGNDVFRDELDPERAVVALGVAVAVGMQPKSREGLREVINGLVDSNGLLLIIYDLLSGGWR